MVLVGCSVGWRDPADVDHGVEGLLRVEFDQHGLLGCLGPYGGDSGQMAAVAKPPQPQHSLPKSGQRPRAGAGSATASFELQQPHEMTGKVTRHVEDDRMSNHGELLVIGIDLQRDQSYQGALRHQHGSGDSEAAYWCEIVDLVRSRTGQRRRNSPNAARTAMGSDPR